MLRLLLVLALIVSTLACAPAGHAQRTLTAAPSAASEQRIALIIGNSAYKEAPLRNPVNDATDMAQALRAIGFAVTLRTNATHREMEQAIQQFGLDIRRGGVGLFYFAGHGIQSRGTNYLVPVGANLMSEADLKFQSVDTGWVLAQMEEARNRVNIVVLDACRNNPYSRSFRSAARGLAQMDAAKGSFLAFATAPGDVAQDGAGRNGTYTKHLLASLRQPESDIFQVFSRVTQAVAKETREKQIPWFNSSLTGRFQFRLDGEAVQAAPDVPIAPVTESTAVELAFWDSIRTSTSRADFEEYLRQYPDGRFAGLARNRLHPLSAAPQAQVASATPSIAATRPPATEAAGRIERPDIRVGERWTYQVTDGFTNLKSTVVMEVTTVTDNQIHTRRARTALAAVMPTAAAGAVDVFNRDWNLLREDETEYAPHYPSFQFPLEIGRSWSGTVQFSRSDGPVVQRLTAEVAGWERVAVPAGSFDAVKINLRGSYRLHNDMSHRLASTGDLSAVVWYAPAVRQVVKREINRSDFSAYGSMALKEHWELVEYKPN